MGMDRGTVTVLVLYNGLIIKSPYGVSNGNQCKPQQAQNFPKNYFLGGCTGANSAAQEQSLQVGAIF